MLFIVRFHDNPARLAVRKQYLQAHLDWLSVHQDSVLVAGSLRGNPDDAPTGALWIVEAGSRDEVSALLKSDPFWLHGLRQEYEILHWSKAFPDSRTSV